MKKLFYLFIASIAVTAVSCDKDFEEINISPNSSQTTDPNLLLSSTITATQNTIYNMQIGGDMGLCWAQHMSKVQYNDEEKYIPRRALMNSMWSVMYTSVISEADAAYDLAGIDGNTNLQAAALIMKANAFQILTDVFGPVPFTEANVPGVVKPVFDDQETVYVGILGLLDQAETLLASGAGTITPSADLVYGGDVSKWRKFAASLKLKALMRVSNKTTVGPINVSSEIASVVASGLLFSSNADSAELAYTSAQPDANPIYETIVFTPRAEYKVSSVLISTLNGISDPRLPVYAQLNDSNAYVGNIPGVENPGSYGAFSSPGTFYLEATLPGVLLSYAQVEFLLAEAINETIIPGTLADAKMHYVNGITANFAFNGLAAPTPAYLSSVDFTTQAAGRTQIGTQVWLALYGQGIEAWTEWRRTGVPALAPVVDAAIPSIPKRFYYSTDSQNYNQANYAAAAATLDNGDSMLSKVWWMN